MLCGHFAWSQNKRNYTSNTNSWIAYTCSYKFSNKLSFHLEAQARRHEFVQNNLQYLFRTGINYHANPQFLLTAGYCFVETYPYGEFAAKSSFPENRIWEQIQIKNQLGIIEAINRMRIEQRFVNAPVLSNGTYAPGDPVYSNRTRILNRFSIPLKGKTIEDKTFYISAFDEVYINFGKNIANNIFDQNRAYFGFGYKIPKAGRLEIGYLNQLLFKADGIKVENNHTIQIGLTSSFDFKKPKEQAK